MLSVLRAVQMERHSDIGSLQFAIEGHRPCNARGRFLSKKMLARAEQLRFAANIQGVLNPAPRLVPLTSPRGPLRARLRYVPLGRFATDARSASP